jgi:hypothetical protein
MGVNKSFKAIFDVQLSCKFFGVVQVLVSHARYDARIRIFGLLQKEGTVAQCCRGVVDVVMVCNCCL